MIRALIAVRFRALFSGFGSGRNKKKSTARTVLLALLFVYLFAVIGGVMAMAFGTLSATYHAIGLDWLYFSLAGLAALGLSIFGSAFASQSQLYDAKDNDLLLAMPIPSRYILISRLIPLLALDLLYSGVVMVPAIVMYAIRVSFTPAVILQVIIWIFLCILGQSISSLLGWLLHRLLQKANRSVVSMVYMILFLGVYFFVYSKAQTMLNTIAASGEQLAGVFRVWIWPMYAMGAGCLGDLLYMAAFLGICAALFVLVCAFLSATFLRSTVSYTPKKKKLVLDGRKTHSPVRAVAGKELRRFLGTPIYLTNCGLGLILMAALPVAAVFLRGKIREALLMSGLPGAYLSLIVCALMFFLLSTVYISAPSVSLEGKSIWVLKCMPLSPGQILMGKFLFHVLMTVPLAAVSSFATALIIGCDALSALLCAVISSLTGVFSGLLGLWSGLQWAKLDYISDTYPVKQSPGVAVCLFGIMGIPVILGLGYFFLLPGLSPTVFLGICAVVMAVLCLIFYRLVTTRSIRKWEALY